MLLGSTELKIRSDSMGDGAFGARRGSRTHRGVDYRSHEGQAILSPVAGRVSKLGYCYGSGIGGASSVDPLRYIEITAAGLRHRFFYVRGYVAIGDVIRKNQVICFADDVCRRYPDTDMQSHVHYEIMDSDDQYIDPS